ncbi:MAG: right-handed parallel beta-helix repeat-containing protein, partial [Clostridia bacterium]|nr:right-handed parallel beta-helix repeat-containing protein [Clostridia bacterium]
DDADFYVSPDGDDTADGSFGRPFRTWERARDAVRTLDRTGRSGIKVAFMAGDYGPLSIELTKEDSGTAECPVTYCKYGDGDVAFNNGFTVSEDEFVPLDAEDEVFFKEKYRGDIKKADVSDRLYGYDPVSAMILGEDGVCTLARFPNIFPDGSDQLIRGANTVDDNHIVISSPLYKNRIRDYRTTDGLILYGYITLGWFKDFIPTGGVETDPETGDYTFFIPHPEDTRGGHLRYEDWFAVDYYQFAVVNISEELDAGGEYWIDPDTMTMYVYAPSGSYHFCDGDANMVRMKGTQYVTLRGLDFRNSNKTIINATDHPRGLTVELCKFSGCTEENMNVIDARKKGVPLDVTVRGCEFSLTAGRALYIWGLNKEDLFGTGTGVVVDNNLFTLTGLKIGLVAALAVKSSAPEITHNLFTRCYWQCIDFSRSVNMICEYNVFDQACCNGDDTGAMGKWYEIEACGNVIRYNLFMNITGGTGGRFSIYLDDGAVGTDILSNLFYNVTVTVMDHRGRYVSFCDNAVVKGPGGTSYDTEDTIFTEEAMAAGDVEAIYNYEPYRIWVAAFEYFDSHPSIKAQAMEYWPGLFEITTDVSRWNEREFCLNESLVITGNRWIRRSGETEEYSELLRKYSTIEDNIGYTLDENPLFVNPTLGDYRIREGVDFPDIHFEEIGRY